MGLRTPSHEVPFFLQLQLSKQFKIQAFKTYYVQTIQHKHERLADLIAYLKSDQLPPDNNMARSLLLIVNVYFLYDNILYHLWTPTGRKKKGPFLQFKLFRKDYNCKLYKPLMMMFWLVIFFGNPNRGQFKDRLGYVMVSFGSKHLETAKKGSQRFMVLCSTMIFSHARDI